MTARKRLHFKNAKYHIMLRGNYRQPIFNEQSDYQRMYSIMAKVSVKFECKFLMFCLMTNHTHMVIEVNDIPLSKIMQSLASQYSRYFNKKNDVEGHLFQGRYVAKPVMNEQYLLELIYYIHNNPLAANMCSNLDEYPWSSHRHYKGIETIPWLKCDEVVQFLQAHFQSKTNYYDCVFEQQNDNPEESICEIDDDGLLSLKAVNIIDKSIEKPIDLRCFNLKEIINDICTHVGVPTQTVSEFNLNRKTVLARALIAFFAHYYAGYQLNHIAGVYCQNRDSVSLNMHKMLKNQKYTKLKKEIYLHFADRLKSKDSGSDTEN